MADTLKVHAPFDHHVIAELPMATEAEALDMVAQAHRVFKDRSQWLKKHERIAILEKVAEKMAGQVDHLARLAAEEGGKPFKDSKAEVLRAVNGVKLAVEHIGQMKGEEVPMGMTPASDGHMAFTTYEPIGPVVAISAFNHPLNLIVHQAIPAVAVGAPVIVKPALTTPLSALNLIEMLHDAGLPKAWCQPLICEDAVSEKVVTHEKINFMTFIGSQKVGWMLRSKLAPGTRYALEHGGAAPVVIDKSADWQAAIEPLAKASFYHAGQVCVSAQRLFVHEDIFDDFAAALTEKAKSLKVGNPLDEDTEVGPLILHREVNRVEQWIDKAIAEGAKITCGGERIGEECYAPTVLLNPSPDSLVSQEEIFGPVACLYKYSDLDDAITQANSLKYAFQAAVFAKDLDVALDCVNRLNAATVTVNQHTAFRVDWMPFGGRDASGEGIGGIQYTMHDMMRHKLVVFKSPVLA